MLPVRLNWVPFLFIWHCGQAVVSFVIPFPFILLQLQWNPNCAPSSYNNPYSTPYSTPCEGCASPSLSQIPSTSYSFLVQIPNSALFSDPNLGFAPQVPCRSPNYPSLYSGVPPLPQPLPPTPSPFLEGLRTGGYPPCSDRPSSFDLPRSPCQDLPTLAPELSVRLFAPLIRALNSGVLQQQLQPSGAPTVPLNQPFGAPPLQTPLANQRASFFGPMAEPCACLNNQPCGCSGSGVLPSRPIYQPPIQSLPLNGPIQSSPFNNQFQPPIQPLPINAPYVQSPCGCPNCRCDQSILSPGGFNPSFSPQSLGPSPLFNNLPCNCPPGTVPCQCGPISFQNSPCNCQSNSAICNCDTFLKRKQK